VVDHISFPFDQNMQAPNRNAGVHGRSRSCASEGPHHPPGSPAISCPFPGRGGNGRSRVFDIACAPCAAAADDVIHDAASPTPHPRSRPRSCGSSPWLYTPPFAHPECPSQMSDSFLLGRGRHHFFPKRSFNATLKATALHALVLVMGQSYLD
jgi:hypothetical protein